MVDPVIACYVVILSVAVILADARATLTRDDVNIPNMPIGSSIDVMRGHRCKAFSCAVARFD